MRKILLVGPVIAVTLLGCSATSNFKSQTESFIESDEIEVPVAAMLEMDSVEIVDATCEEPASSDVGTTYECSATVEGSGPMDFLAEITKEDAFTVLPKP